MLDSPIRSSSSSEPSPLDVETVFRVMAYRRLMRQFHGTYRKNNRFKTFWTLGFLMWSCGLVGVSSSSALNVNIDFSENVISFILTCILLYVALKTVIVVRWCLYWVVIAVTLVFFLNGAPDLEKTGLTAASKNIYIISWLVCMEVLTVMVWFAIHHGYPRFVRDSKLLNVRSWWKIKASSDGKVNSFVYRPSTPWPFVLCNGSEERTFKYEGEMDKHGRPHGLGKWTDSATHGEHYEGYWDSGSPVARKFFVRCCMHTLSY
jgi:hypothetical protein